MWELVCRTYALPGTCAKTRFEEADCVMVSPCTLSVLICVFANRFPRTIALLIDETTLYPLKEVLGVVGLSHLVV